MMVNDDAQEATPTARRRHEAAIAGIDADVRDARLVGVLEEDQIAFPQIGAIHRLPGARLVGRHARQAGAGRLLDGPLHQARAVERAGLLAAPHVGAAELAARHVDDGLASTSGGWRGH
jgi:hypothetical protein